MNSMMTISFLNVSKKYYLQKQKTFKEFLPSFFLGETWAKEFWALSDITFSLSRGESLGILGKNGAGKSTLLKLIAGVTAPTKGIVEVHGRVSPLIELGAGFHPELTGRENIYLNGSIMGMQNKDIDKNLSDIIQFAELTEFIDQPIKHYSSGMYMRLAFSVAIAQTPDILIIDEIFAVGDAAFREKCIKKMEEFRSKKVSFIIVSHSMDYIETFCNKGLVLHNGKQKFFGDVQQATHCYKNLLSSTV